MSAHTLEAERLAEVAAAFDPSTVINTIPVISYTTIKERGPLEEINLRLSMFSRMALDAACLLQQAQPQAHLMFATERTHKGMSSTGTIMAERAVAKGIPDYMMHVFDNPKKNLRNTPLQIAKLAKGIHIGKTVAISMGFHSDRLRSHAAGFGLNLTVLNAEDVLKFVGGYNEPLPTPEILEYFDKQEQKFRIWSKFDKRGYALRAISPFYGSRIQDVVIDERGQQTPLDDRAKRWNKEFSKR